MALAKSFYFTHHAGQMAVASSIEARAGEKLVRVGFSNSYRGSADDAPILRAGGEKGAQFFKQSFELKIKGDMIPESAEVSISFMRKFRRIPALRITQIKAKAHAAQSTRVPIASLSVALKPLVEVLWLPVVASSS